MSNPKAKLIEQFHAGDFGEVEFTELALDIGLTLAEIGAELMNAREESDEEETDEDRHKAGICGVFGCDQCDAEDGEINF